MNSGTLIAEAWISLTKNKVRTVLSMLGIIIGVGAVIILVAMAQATKLRIEDEIARLGDDWMFIRNFSVQASGLAKADVQSKPMQTKHDADAINEQCTLVRAATPSNRMTMQVKSSYANYSANVQGVYPNYHDIRRWEVISGRKLDDRDEIAKRPVCVIGLTAAKELFGSMNPVGEEITVKSGRFKIVGLLEFKGMSDQRDNDDVILFPFSTFERKIAGAEVSQTLIAAAAHGVDPKLAEDQIRRLLRERHRLRPGDADDFRLFALSESAQVKEESSASFSWLLGMIAGVSLVVGGIGIMNIMLVSVTERTREIGIRMAVGARGSDVLSQFLVEAVVMSVAGGLIGVGVGIGSATILQQVTGWGTSITPQMVGVAIGFSASVGIFFGFYPARKAAALDPIQALRYE